MSPYYTNSLIKDIVSKERAGKESASKEIASKEIASIWSRKEKASKVR